MNRFAENLKNLRKSHNLTQNDLAEKLFVSAQTVSRWENGDGEPSLDLLSALADTFGVSVDRLVSDKSMPQAELFEDIRQTIAEMPAECSPCAIRQTTWIRSLFPNGPCGW